MTLNEIIGYATKNEPSEAVVKELNEYLDKDMANVSVFLLGIESRTEFDQYDKWFRVIKDHPSVAKLVKSWAVLRVNL